jgi:hypothetical protein
MRDPLPGFSIRRPQAEPRTYYLGMDPAFAPDWSATAMIELPPDTDNLFELTMLDRFDRGTPYPDQVRAVKRMVGELYELRHEKAAIFLDTTGVGRPLLDLYREAGMPPTGILITGGHVSQVTGDLWCVPKLDLIMGLVTALELHRLHVAAGLKFGSIFAAELASFRITVRLSDGKEDVGTWRENQNDDLVFAVAIALWGAQRKRIEGLTAHLRRKQMQAALW